MVLMKQLYEFKVLKNQIIQLVFVQKDEVYVFKNKFKSATLKALLLPLWTLSGFSTDHYYCLYENEAKVVIGGDKIIPAPKYIH